MTLKPRAVMVHRRTEYEELIARHGTHLQAAFFLDARGRDIAEVHARHQAQEVARAAVAGAIPPEWRRAEAERGDLDRFVFGPEDVVVVVGQDGLVANVAKYLDGQPVIGIDPEPGRNAGVLVRHPAEAATGLLVAAIRPGIVTEERTMVEATTDDGQVLRAVNELYFGHASHQSARYSIRLCDGRAERQSSSGVLAGTGTGATGWLRSAWQERQSPLELPGVTDAGLCWFVREAWPSPGTGTELTEGWLGEGEALTLVAETDQLVCFGDGIEHDSLVVSWGQRLTIGVSERRLRLVA